MSQVAQQIVERRADTRWMATFTFWFRRPQATRRAGAWMLNQGPSGAAFLAAASDAPRVGEQLELSHADPFCAATGEQPREEPDSLPRSARVVRLDKPQGITQRVAVQYEQ
jgi:hypothetical protein